VPLLLDVFTIVQALHGLYPLVLLSEVAVNIATIILGVDSIGVPVTRQEALARDGALARLAVVTGHAVSALGAGSHAVLNSELLADTVGDTALETVVLVVINAIVGRTVGKLPTQALNIDVSDVVELVHDWTGSVLGTVGSLAGMFVSIIGSVGVVVVFSLNEVRVGEREGAQAFDVSYGTVAVLLQDGPLEDLEVDHTVFVVSNNTTAIGSHVVTGNLGGLEGILFGVCSKIGVQGKFLFLTAGEDVTQIPVVVRFVVAIGTNSGSKSGGMSTFLKEDASTDSRLEHG